MPPTSRKNAAASRRTQAGSKGKGASLSTLKKQSAPSKNAVRMHASKKGGSHGSDSSASSDDDDDDDSSDDDATAVDDSGSDANSSSGEDGDDSSEASGGSESEDEDAPHSTNPYGVVVAANVPLVKAFRDLAFYEGRCGNKWGRIANFKVARALTYYDDEVRSGKEVRHLAGIGKNSIARIEEFLTSAEASKSSGDGRGGTMKSLEAFKATFGSSYTPPSIEDYARQNPFACPPPAAIVAKVEAAKAQFSRMPVADLKRLLKANGQAMMGLKEGIVQRVAEGYVMGAIPNCPKCYGGRPRYDITTGIYSCPGYMDDDTFVNCYFKGRDGLGGDASAGSNGNGNGSAPSNAITIVRRGWRSDVNLPQHLPQQEAVVVVSTWVPSWVAGFIDFCRYKLNKWLKHKK